MGSKFTVEFVALTEKLDRAFDKTGDKSASLSKDFKKTGKASLDLREATLKVEAAQGKAARAVDRYGKESLQAAQAQVRLEREQQKISRSTDTQSKKTGILSGHLGKAAKAAAGFAVAYASISTVKDAVSVTEDLGKSTLTLAKSFGLSTKSASEWAAVSKVRGAEGAKLVMGFKSLSTQVRNATQGIGAQGDALDVLRKKNDLAYRRAQRDAAMATDQGAATRRLTRLKQDQATAEEALSGKVSTQAKTFAELGISQAALAKHGNNLEWVLAHVSDGMEKLPAGTEKSAVAAKLFGRTWTTIAPLIRNGSDEMRAQLALADKYGATLGGKTVEDIQKLLMAQREQKLAWMGIQVQLGQALIPTLTKASAGFAQFVGEMRSGKGTGGDVAETLGNIATQAKATEKWIAGAAEDVGRFADKHPEVAKVAGALVAVGVAVKAIKFASAVTGVTDLIRLTGRLGRTKAGSAAVGAIVDQLSLLPLRGRLAMSTAGDWLKRMMGRSGGVAGEKAAAEAASSMASQLPGSLKSRSGRFAAIGKGLGRVIGVAAAAAAALAISEGIAEALGQGADKRRNLRGQGTNPFGSSVGGNPAGPNPWDQWADDAGGWVRGKLGLRDGGRIRRYADGGLVPAYVSSGEEIRYGNSSWTVPGPRVAQDNVFSMLPVGAAVITDDGQNKMRAGASLGQALATQAPHFAGGGIVTGKYEATAYGPPWDAMNGTGTTATGVKLAGTPTGKAGPFVVAVDPTMIPLHSKVNVWPNPFNWKGQFSAEDTGGAIKGRHLDFLDMMGRSHQMAWGDRAVRVSKGDGGPASSFSYLRQASVLHPRTVDLSQPYGALDAFQQGFDQTSGRLFRTPTGLDSDLFRSAMSGIGPNARDLPKRIRVALEGSMVGRTGNDRVDRMLMAGASIVGKPYVYGGGHASFNDSSGYDCSGAVSKVLGAGGFLSSPTSTDGLKTFGSPGGGKLVTVGVRGSSGQNAHTMIRVGSRFLEAGGGGPYGQHNVHWDPDWDGDFPIKRHPAGFRRGGLVNVAPFARKRTGLRSNDSRLYPGAPRFVGWGMRRGGVVGYRAGGTVGQIVSSIGAAPVRDTAGVTTKMRQLGSILDTTEQITYRRLARLDAGIRSNIAGLAHGGLTGVERVQVRRLRGALTLVEATMGRRVGQAVASSQRALNNVSSNQTLIGRAMAIKGIDEGGELGLRTMVASDRNSIGALRGQRAGLLRALKRAQRANQPAAVQSIRDQLDTLNGTIGDTKVTLAGRQRDLAHLQRYQPNDVAMALAQLTGGSEDDIAALKTRQGLLAEDLQQAQARGDAQATIDLAGQLASTRDALQSLTDAVDEDRRQREELTALTQQVAENQNRILAVANSQPNVLLGAITAALNGSIGGKVGLGFQTPGYAGGPARY